MFSSTDLIHKLIDWRFKIDDSQVLNASQPPEEGETAVAVEFFSIFQQMKSRAFPENGCVDYALLRRSSIFAAYKQQAQNLQRFSAAELETHEEKLAFWINLYNALIIDAIISFDVKKSVNDIPGFFWKAAYNIGGHRFSASDIEFGVLRANAGHPAIPGPQFGPDDPRRAYSLTSLDPRIHFAMVCASYSCPPLRVYSPQDVDRQLDLVARDFIDKKGIEIDPDKKRVALSKIFSWYAPDFGGPWLGIGNMRPVLRYISNYIDDPSKKFFLLNGKPKVRFLPYDWALNHNDIPERVRASS